MNDSPTSNITTSWQVDSLGESNYLIPANNPSLVSYDSGPCSSLLE